MFNSFLSCRLVNTELKNKSSNLNILIYNTKIIKMLNYIIINIFLSLFLTHTKEKIKIHLEYTFTIRNSNFMKNDLLKLMYLMYYNTLIV